MTEFPETADPPPEPMPPRDPSWPAWPEPRPDWPDPVPYPGQLTVYDEIEGVDDD